MHNTYTIRPGRRRLGLIACNCYWLNPQGGGGSLDPYGDTSLRNIVPPVMGIKGSVRCLASLPTTEPPNLN